MNGAIGSHRLKGRQGLFSRCSSGNIRSFQRAKLAHRTMSSIVASFLSSFFPNAHADAPEEGQEVQSNVAEGVQEEEEEEPEDVSSRVQFLRNYRFPEMGGNLG